MSGSRRIASRALLLLAGLGFGLLLAEMLCKGIDVVQMRRNHAQAGRLSRPSGLADVRFELIPNVTAPAPGTRDPIRVNSLGFRGPELAVKKPEGALRVAALGDSIAFGRTLPEEQIFPTVLGELLRARWPGRTVEVINASLSGRDTWEEAAILEHRVLPLAPDVVVLQVCLNDHVRLPKVSGVRHGAFGERPWYGYSSLMAQLDQRVAGFRAWRVVWMQRWGMDTRTATEIVQDQMVSQAGMLQVEEHWEAWQAPLERIHRMTQQAGCELMIAVFPIELEIRRKDPETLPLLRTWAEARGIPYVDLMPVLAERFPARFRDYTHPNAEGHRAVAEHLAERIAPKIGS